MIHETIEDTSIKRLQIDRTEASEGKVDSCRQIHLATDLDLDEEIATAYFNLNRLYDKCLGMDDYKLGLQVVKERIRILKWLEDRKPDDSNDSDPEVCEMAAKLELVRQHLVPLGLASETTSIAEHARLAATIVSTHQYKLGMEP